MASLQRLAASPINDQANDNTIDEKGGVDIFDTKAIWIRQAQPDDMLTLEQ
jgi:hypothetical protein